MCGHPTRDSDLAATRHPRLHAWLASLLVLLSACASAPKEGRLRTAAEAALQAIGARTGRSPSGLTVVASTKARYAHLDHEVFAFKISDGDGGLHGVTLNEDLREVDPAKLAADDRALRRSRMGALDPALAARLGEGRSEALDVVVWVADTRPRSGRRPAARGETLKPGEIDTLYAEADESRRHHVSAILAPVLERVRTYDPQAHADTLSPAITAKLKPDALRALAGEPDIARIYLDPPVAPELDVAKATTGIAQLHLAGTLGSGVRVAAIIDDGRVETASLLLRPVVQDTINLCANVSDHSTSVAGALVERRFSFLGLTAGEEGAAPAVELRVGGSCSKNSDDLRSASDRAAAWGARAMNLSWGLDTGLVPGAMDRFYDEIVLHRFRTIVKSAGNRNCPGAASPQADGNVSSPGLAYNVITVGGFDDHNTPTWADDTIYACSSFRDPVSTHGDRQKPEIAAPAVGITVVRSGPADVWDVTGTSIAAPIVTGTVALLIERNSRLSFWPEIVRAILMATATHNVEGGTRLSDVDGAGGLVASAAADLIGDPQRWSGVGYECGGSTPSPLNLATLSVGPRTRHRVVLSWDTDPSFADYETRPSSDIDLRVVDATGRTVASSVSWDNTFEIVEFDSWTAGTYTVQALKYRCDLPTWLGWAWHTRPIRGL